MMGLEHACMKDANDLLITSSTVSVTPYIFPSSWNNIIKADGFNIHVTYLPDAWQSFTDWKNYIKLVKNNSLKIIDNSNYYFKPSAANSSSGQNKYSVSNCASNSAGNNEYIMNVDEVANGMYMLRIQKQGQAYNEKISIYK